MNLCLEEGTDECWMEAIASMQKLVLVVESGRAIKLCKNAASTILLSFNGLRI